VVERTAGSLNPGLSLPGLFILFNKDNTPAMKHLLVLTFLFLSLFCAVSQNQSRHMDFEEYEPKSTLVVPQHLLTHAKFPFFDVHNHQ
jgi:hypothetical protein